MTPKTLYSDPIATDLAILGAGPTGLEAALAAWQAGRDFLLLESAATVAGQIERWRHVRLFTPWSMNVSPRMRAALDAAGSPAPNNDSCPTGGELIDRVLAPIGALPAIADRLRLASHVQRVGRTGLLKHEAIASKKRGSEKRGSKKRGQSLFRILVSDRAAATGGVEQVITARSVLDCTGNIFPTCLGDGGIPALGEAAAAASGWIDHEIPQLETDRARWAGHRILLVGAGHSAQTAARDLAGLVAEHPATRIAWSVRNPRPSWGAVADDPLPDRAALARFAANVVAEPNDSPIQLLAGTVIDRLEPRSDGVAVGLLRVDGTTMTIEVDRVLALTGRVGDDRLYRQLQIHECYATSGPMKLAAALMGDSAAAGDCLAQQSHGPDTLRNPEPGFFILGVKSYGRRNDFLMRVGWQQVDDVFSLLEE